MKTCKNCNVEIENHRTYCSYKCRNIYVNKNLRDYSKIVETFKIKYEDKYYENPKKCIVCNEVIPYDKKDNIFCGSSCSAKYNNKFKKGLKHNLTEQGYNNILIANQKRSKDNININDYNLNPKKCLFCNKELPFNKRKQTFCSSKCVCEYRTKEYEKNMNEYQIYRKECKFNFALNDFPTEFDFELIKIYGWYQAKNHGDNLGGVSRDHMFSINEGFKQNINPKLINHPANCKLMIHNENSSKCKKCSITIVELEDRINEWNKKYLK